MIQQVDGGAAPHIALHRTAAAQDLSHACRFTWMDGRNGHPRCEPDWNPVRPLTRTGECVLGLNRIDRNGFVPITPACTVATVMSGSQTSYPHPSARRGGRRREQPQRLRHASTRGHHRGVAAHANRTRTSSTSCRSFRRVAPTSMRPMLETIRLTHAADAGPRSLRGAAARGQCSGSLGKPSRRTAST